MRLVALHSLLLACVVAVSTTAAASTSSAATDSVVQPTLLPQDTWTYRDTVERRPTLWHQTHMSGVVVRQTGTTLLLQNTEVGSPNPPIEWLTNADWSRFRSVDGQETVVSRPFVFPLTLGKSWDLAYTEDHPGNPAHKSEQRKLHYRVVGWEEVEVPAGTFKALKIEVDGTWSTETNPRSAVTIAREGGTVASQMTNSPSRAESGRIYESYWYSPDVKRSVKTLSEYYDANGVRNERTTVELESYKVAH